MPLVFLCDINSLTGAARFLAILLTTVAALGFGLFRFVSVCVAARYGLALA